MRPYTLLASVLVIASPAIANGQGYGVATPPPSNQPQDESEPADDEATFSVSGQVRLREEVHHGLYYPWDPTGNTNFDLTHLRNRAAITMHKGDVSAVVEIQDTRWLGQAGTTEDSEGVDLRRGALKVEKLFETSSWVEAGRMVLFYGDHRLIGHLEWVNQARTFDGARGRIVPDAMADSGWIDVFATVTRETREAHDDQYFGGSYASFTPGATGWKSEFYALGLIDRLELPGEEADGKSAFATVGTRQAYKRHGLDSALEIAGQFGEVAGDKLRAMGLAARAAYTFESAAAKPRFGGEFVYGTGDSDFADGTNETFQTLFPTNHLHYGYADEAAWSNLTAVKASVGIAPIERWRADLDYHHLRLTNPGGGWFNAAGVLVRPGDETASSHLGDEIDVVSKFRWRPGLDVELGYALFLPGGFVEDTGDSDAAHFGYLQLQASIE